MTGLMTAGLWRREIKTCKSRSGMHENGNPVLGAHAQSRPIAAEMAGVRKLKFSPLGSGKRVLVAAEPADFVSIIDAATFSSKQTLSFFWRDWRRGFHE